MLERLRWMALMLCAALLALAGAAHANGAPQTYKRYTLERTGTVRYADQLTAYGRAYLLLPANWKSRTPDRRSSRRLYVPGSCKVTVDASVSHVVDDAAETADQRAQRRWPADRQYVYGEGTRNRVAAWRVIRVAGRKIVRGFYTQPLSEDWPGVPAGKRVWLEVQVTGRAHNPSCHTGGIREAVAWKLVDAFGAMSATGFARSS